MKFLILIKHGIQAVVLNGTLMLFYIAFERSQLFRRYAFASQLAGQSLKGDARNPQILQP